MLKDVFKFEYLQDLEIDYSSVYEFPKVNYANEIPNKMIPFNYAKTTKNKSDYWVHFYIDDYQFNRIWHNPKKYINLLKQFKGVIEPDFSIYANLPKAEQVYAIYKQRFMSAYFSKNGIKVIPNITWSDDASFEFTLQGIPKNNVVCTSTNGMRFDKKLQKDFIKKLKIVEEKINYSKILVVGFLFEDLDKNNKVIQYDNYKQTVYKKLNTQFEEKK